MAKLITSQKGLSMIEILVVVTIIGLLASMGIPGYQELRRNSFQHSGMAQLAAYHRSAKIMMGEFGYNPGNFVGVGFRLEGEYYYRITAADNKNGTVSDPPDYYPNDDACVATNDTCSYFCSPPCWKEILTSSTYTSPKTPEVDDMSFKVYAFSDDTNNYLCTDEAGVYAGDCP